MVGIRENRETELTRWMLRIALCALVLLAYWFGHERGERAGIEHGRQACMHIMKNAR